MCITRKKSTVNLKPIDNLIVSPDASTVYGELCWLIWLQNQEASRLKQRLAVCVISVTEWLVSNVVTRSLVRTCKFRAANITSPALGIFISRNRRHLFAEPWDSSEPSLRNTGLKESSLLSPTLFLEDTPIFDFVTYGVLSYISKRAILFIGSDCLRFVVLNKDKNGMIVSLNFKMPVVTNYVSD